MGTVINVDFTKPKATFEEPQQRRHWTEIDAHIMLRGMEDDTKVMLTGAEAKDLFESVVRRRAAEAWMDAAVERLQEAKGLVDQIREALDTSAPEYQHTEAAFLARSMFLDGLINSREGF